MLLDEGPVRLHVTAAMRRARGHRLLVSTIPTPDVLVIVTCDPMVRLARARRKNRPGSRSSSDEEIVAQSAEVDFARRFAATRNVPVVEIDTTVECDHVPRLCELLQQFLDAPRNFPIESKVA